MSAKERRGNICHFPSCFFRRIFVLPFSPVLRGTERAAEGGDLYLGMRNTVLSQKTVSCDPLARFTNAEVSYPDLSSLTRELRSTATGRSLPTARNSGLKTAGSSRRSGDAISEPAICTILPGEPLRRRFAGPFPETDQVDGIFHDPLHDFDAPADMVDESEQLLDAASVRRSAEILSGLSDESAEADRRVPPERDSIFRSRSGMTTVSSAIWAPTGAITPTSAFSIRRRSGGRRRSSG